MGSVTFAILIISSVAVIGLLFGGVRLRGIGLGPGGVLFAGILFSYCGAVVDPVISHFAKEFGLILFVFTTGIQLGPGVVQMWRKHGIRLNAMALAIVFLGVVLVISVHRILNLSVFTSAGLFCGATTNTPALGAAEQAVSMLENQPGAALGSLACAYAVAYPGAIVGIISTMVLLRRILNVNIEAEARTLNDLENATYEPIERSSILIDNAHLHGIVFGRIPGVDDLGVRISRIRRAGEDTVSPANDATEIKTGDVLQIVGTRSSINRFTPLVGQSSDVNLMHAPGNVGYRRVFVTDPHALNRPLRELALDKLFSATVTRIIRPGIETTARGSSRFHYGDIAQIVGDEVALNRATNFLGNSGKALNDTPFLPLFVGIIVGVLLGMIPFQIPGVPFPVRLGLAGGPLLAAIILSLVGNIGDLVWYIPSSANRALKELGIILFLACAGLATGPSFFTAFVSFDGVKWMVAGFLVTVIPLMTTGIIARLWWKENYLVICGVIAGSMTDPPALAFANSLAESEASSTAYAAVYPLTMILRIVSAQSLVLLLS
jgi:putative transport protein